MKKGLRALNCSVFLDANRQPSPSGRRKSHDFKRRRPETSVHGFVIALRRARAQSAAADGARNRNRIEATVTDSFFDQDRHDVCRNQIPAGTDCRDAEYDLSAK